jgi:hypothetical protein
VMGKQSTSAEDPSVAKVEQLLAAAAPATSGQVPGGRPLVGNALWICACVSFDDAPTWLVYEQADGELSWCRVPDGCEPLDLLEASASAGGHADPESVLAWLEGREADPWGGGGSGWDDGSVLEELGQSIQSRRGPA